MSFEVRTGTWLIAAAILSGCASHRPQSMAQRFVRADPAASTAGGGDVHDPSLQRVMAEARLLASESRPPRAGEARTLEQSDPELSAAQMRLSLAPTTENHRQVAQAYARLGVLDAAYDHFTAALHLTRKDATSYDGRARIWRDWGLAPLALSDAYQAIYYAPKSPVPQNTLGTLLLKMGLVAEARTAFERSLALDPSASYARANVCAVSRRMGDTSRALDTCSEATSNDAIR